MMRHPMTTVPLLGSAISTALTTGKNGAARNGGGEIATPRGPRGTVLLSRWLVVYGGQAGWLSWFKMLLKLFHAG